MLIHLNISEKTLTYVAILRLNEKLQSVFMPYNYKRLGNESKAEFPELETFYLHPEIFCHFNARIKALEMIVNARNPIWTFYCN
jgi:hypothetical protein